MTVTITSGKETHQAEQKPREQVYVNTNKQN